MEERRSIHIQANMHHILYTVWIALCFSLTSSVYMAWLYHLIPIAGNAGADRISMVGGYLFQAAGIVLGYKLFEKKKTAGSFGCFALFVLLLDAVSIPALYTHSLPGVIIYGMLMNALCGVIAFYYQYPLMHEARYPHGGLLFGCGYGISAVLVWLFSVIGPKNYLRTSYAWIILAAFSALILLFTKRIGPRISLFDTAGKAPSEPGTAQTDEEASGDKKEGIFAENISPAENPPADKTAACKLLYYAAAVIFFFSRVKNLGFSFPSVDIESGLPFELSRLFYTAGLFAAGYIHDRDPKTGMICTVCALSTPFIMLSLVQEQYVIRDLLQIGDLVGRDDNRVFPVRDVVPDHVEDGTPYVGIHPRGGLVQQQEVRIP